MACSLNAQYIVGNSSRKSEVLKLIAQVLEFDDDMQRRVIALLVGIVALSVTRTQVGLSGNGWLTWLSGSQANPSDETQVCLLSLVSDGKCAQFNTPV